MTCACVCVRARHEPHRPPGGCANSDGLMGGGGGTLTPSQHACTMHAHDAGTEVHMHVGRIQWLEDSGSRGHRASVHSSGRVRGKPDCADPCLAPVQWSSLPLIYSLPDMSHAACLTTY